MVTTSNHRRPSDAGGTTAEFAVVLPAVLLVFGLIIGGMMLGAHRITLVSAAHDLARLQAREDTALVTARMAQLPSGVTVSHHSRQQLSCVTLTSRPGSGILAQIALSATACAATIDHGGS